MDFVKFKFANVLIIWFSFKKHQLLHCELPIHALNAIVMTAKCPQKLKKFCYLPSHSQCLHFLEGNFV